MDLQKLEKANELAQTCNVLKNNLNELRSIEEDQDPCILIDSRNVPRFHVRLNSKEVMQLIASIIREVEGKYENAVNEFENL